MFDMFDIFSQIVSMHDALWILVVNCVLCHLFQSIAFWGQIFLLLYVSQKQESLHLIWNNPTLPSDEQIRELSNGLFEGTLKIIEFQTPCQMKINFWLNKMSLCSYFEL